MSRSFSRWLLSVVGLVLICGTYALLYADAPQADRPAVYELRGEVIVIESKSGSAVTIETPSVRTIAGRSFLGGAMMTVEPMKTAAELVGGKIWIAVDEITQITEFETKEQLAKSRELHQLLTRKAEAQNMMQDVAPGKAHHEIAKKKLERLESQIEALIAQQPAKETREQE